MKPSLLLVETKCPSGHVQLYRSQIQEYYREYDVTLATTPAYFAKFADMPIALQEIPDHGRSPHGKIGRKILQVKRLFPILKSWRSAGFDMCIVLSFDTHVLGAISRFVPLDGVAFFIHNNVDEILTTRSKDFFFRLIPRTVTFLVFEEFIAKFLRDRFCVNAKAIHHKRRIAPVGNPVDLSPALDRKYVFSPSTECNSDFLIELLEFCQRNHLLLLTKPQPNLPDSPEIIAQSRFDNYDDLLLNAEYIACGIDFQYRISGVLYEALGNNKKILANDCVLVRHMKKEAGESLLIMNKKKQPRKKYAGR